MIAAARRPFTIIVLLAIALHALGIARAILPAQDGLKYIKVAKAFQTQPWSDVVRASDQHPLYPALIALMEPILRAFKDTDPATWQLAAQLVSAIASVAMLFPLRAIAERLFHRRIADLAVLGFVLLPFPMEVGHDTLSDSTALLGFAFALKFGLDALADERWNASLACGLAAGLGFLSRPEVVIVPFAVLLVGVSRHLRLPWPETREPLLKLSALAVACLAIVGAYSLVKGEVSERLAIRESARLGLRTAPKALKSDGHWLPPGLDRPTWDFSPKEEPATVVKRRWREVLGDLLRQWSDGLGTILAVFGVWGLVRDRYIRKFIAIESQDEAETSDTANLGRWAIFAYLVLFSAVLIRHEAKMGYLSSRHVLTLVIITLPWSAAGVYVCGVRLVRALGLSRRVALGLGGLALFLAVSTGVTLQAKASHPSRWGHRAAGLWLAEHAEPGEAVLDTRGWAAFVSALPSYDYWHVRQALTDNHLAYVVVGQEELDADSPRGKTLRAWLGYAATPLISFPEREGGREAGIWVLRYERPESWEGLTP